MTPIDKLAEYFSKLPGIGSRQSRRFAHFVLSRDKQFVDDFSKLLVSAKAQTSKCDSCYHFYFLTNTNTNRTCERCSNPNTNKEILMVVEKDVDLENVQKTGVFDGNFFVLGGSVPILDKKPRSRIRTHELFELIKKRIQDGLKEVIVAFSLTPEGENTVIHVMNILEPLTSTGSIKVSTLGKGFSTGTELEYSDSETLKNALKNRV